jgi:hypothetical protein
MAADAVFYNSQASIDFLVPPTWQHGMATAKDQPV